MQGNESLLIFEVKIDRFIEDLIAFLRQSIGVRCRKISTPQTLMSFTIGDQDRILQLRFVVVGQGDGMPIGRLSWLDQKGVDHICCFVNEDFDCVRPSRKGGWRVQKKRPDEVCSIRLFNLKAA